MSARGCILAKLRAAPSQPLPRPDLAAHFQRFRNQQDELAALRHWAAMMRAVKTEILWARADDWPRQLASWLAAHPQASLLLSDTPHGRAAAAALHGMAAAPALRWFEQAVDGWKAELFDIAAAFTGVRCGIAATGTLVLWPDEREPRTMSLVPPLHIALFDTSTLYPDFYSALSSQRWQDGMPTNALLISGPSKTADIQQTLAYGAHGPRELLVLALLPAHVAPADLAGGQP
ncbi:LutC/YkgG family protein [Chromobacterium sphagni]|uniref:LUD domain-containing protein n=1 Tax=Chromobacterium sphagni TaxID=1903179 RepID=A0A1S1WVY0_9NEIS|nr:lactate utilization protein [Chromobacterium sphagni]OHX11421.1 hypothetical protein BI347_17250 [Chromobacterium sphagni]OHX20959.1 hypothetical protein BI344_13480 [Chromobacterium sphagni]